MKRVLCRKTLGKNSFFSDTEAFFFNNAGTARPLVCAVTTIKPMPAAELHILWLESLPEWGGGGIGVYNVGIRQGFSGYFD